MICAAIREAIEAAAAAVQPPERVPLSEWADKHRRLSSEGSVQPGAWQSYPFQQEPLNAIAPNSPYETVVLCWAAQMSKSEALL